MGVGHNGQSTAPRLPPEQSGLGRFVVPEAAGGLTDKKKTQSCNEPIQDIVEGE